MQVISTKIKGVYIIEPRLFKDNRGYFFEVYQKEKFKQIGIDMNFVQDNQSMSMQGTLRGMHCQLPPYEQAKLVRVLKGRIFDVVVDMRKDSKTYGHWVGEELSDENRKMLYVPPQFLHGFYVLSDIAEIEYKCSNYYNRESERTVKWDDPDINIDWPIIKEVPLTVSDRDQHAPCLKATEINYSSN
jgi:dTDP-4-dehydrorhamnose 3,5-epimerase